MSVVRPELRWPERGGKTRILLLLGKPPERSPVLPDVVTELRRRGAVVAALVPTRDRLPDEVAESDVVALRGLRRPTLTAVAELEQRGLRCCNRADATLLARSRSRLHECLRAAGVPVPEACAAADADAARAWADGRDVAVKVDDLDAAGGRGVGVSAWTAAESRQPPGASQGYRGPFLVQEWVGGDDVDRKVYVIGDRVAGLLKDRGRGRRPGTPFVPSPEMRDVSVDAGRAVGLDVFGVDLVAGPAGPVVVDVNAFPSCAGVPEAASTIAATLLARAARA